MKQLLSLLACIGLMWLVAITSCKKDNSKPDSINRRPIARAGDDISVQLLSCNDNTASAELDGSGSFDPDSNSLSYSWKLIDGSPQLIVSNSNLSKLKLEKISYGNYVFELTVTDQEGLSAKDNVNVNTTLKEHDLDITFNGAFRFIDDYHYVDFYYDEYYDFTEMLGKVNFSPFGEFNFQISEYTDSSDMSDQHSTIIHIYMYNVNTNNSISGDCSINFKKLIQMGGGPFSGTVKVTSGSAALCNTVLANLPSLSMTGNLDIGSNTITVRIRGKVYL